MRGRTVRFFIGRLVCVGGLIFFSYEYAKNSSYGILSTIIALVLGYLSFEHFSRRNGLSDSDSELVNRFLRVLSSDSNGAIFLRDGVNSEYSIEECRDLDRFLADWNNPDHEFKHKVLEKKRLLFLKALQEFMNLLNKFSSPHPALDHFYTLRRGDRDHEKENEERKRIMVAVRKAYDEYCEFIREVRKRK